jgi:hypothetical protein
MIYPKSLIHSPIQSSLQAGGEAIPFCRTVGIARNSRRKSLLISLFQREKLNNLEEKIKGGILSCFTSRYLRAGIRKGRKPLPKKLSPPLLKERGIKGVRS